MKWFEKNPQGHYSRTGCPRGSQEALSCRLSVDDQMRLFSWMENDCIWNVACDEDPIEALIRRHRETEDAFVIAKLSAAKPVFERKIDGAPHIKKLSWIERLGEWSAIGLVVGLVAVFPALLACGLIGAVFYLVGSL